MIETFIVQPRYQVLPTPFVTIKVKRCIVEGFVFFYGIDVKKKSILIQDGAGDQNAQYILMNIQKLLICIYWLDVGTLKQNIR